MHRHPPGRHAHHPRDRPDRRPGSSLLHRADHEHDPRASLTDGATGRRSDDSVLRRPLQQQAGVAEPEPPVEPLAVHARVHRRPLHAELVGELEQGRDEPSGDAGTPQLRVHVDRLQLGGEPVTVDVRRRRPRVHRQPRHAEHDAVPLGDDAPVRLPVPGRELRHRPAVLLRRLHR
ncbi:hypothetical protein CURTO8I2_290085 [Curtobacterium sp. 8I-2]|nr:hypothetical protein CURTO8I2_290085 [Curtobacterium sp. 8I-2]